MNNKVKFAGIEIKSAQVLGNYNQQCKFNYCSVCENERPKLRITDYFKSANRC